MGLTQTRFFGSSATESDVRAALSEIEVQPASVVKIILVGNSGAGKSFLCNWVVRAARPAVPPTVFEHRLSPTAVTTRCERMLVWSPGACFLVYNLPGLLECDVHKVSRNTKLLIRAASELTEARTSLQFVLPGGGDGAALGSSDVKAFREANKVFQCGAETLVCIHNKLGDTDFASSNDRLRAQQDAASAVRDALGCRRNVYFPTVMPTRKMETTAYTSDRVDTEAAAVAAAETLLQIARSTASHLTINAEASLELATPNPVAEVESRAAAAVQAARAKLAAACRALEEEARARKAREAELERELQQRRSSSGAAEVVTCVAANAVLSFLGAMLSS